MSCSLTVEAVRDRTKTVTRRQVKTWAFLRPGDHLTLVKKVLCRRIEWRYLEIRPLETTTT